MNQLFCIVSFSLLSFSPLATLIADDHGGIHIHLKCGEDVEDDTYEGMVPNVCLELKPWYQGQHYDYYENIESQADRLQEDTAWPGQREEFSDILLR